MGDDERGIYDIHTQPAWLLIFSLRFWKTEYRVASWGDDTVGILARLQYNSRDVHATLLSFHALVRYTGSESRVYKVEAALQPLGPTSRTWQASHTVSTHVSP